MADSRRIKGGEFLLKPTTTEEIFIPEQYSEEQKMMADMCWGVPFLP